ncbi:DUF1993 family protein [Qipengyuania sp.]|uniref:DUF1993 domain-containing protein n=1 Tax=Qipengyuania sp. TaxID=2004515 RepID=UPI0035C7D89A
MTPTSLLVPTYINMLTAFDQWLGKAANLEGTMEGAAPGDAVMAARLAPDMFPLATQVRFACVQAYEGSARLADRALAPLVTELLEEGRAAGERPGTIADGRARIATTLADLETLSAGALDGDMDRALEHALPMGMVFDLTAEQYLRDWAIPQFFFHVMTGYAILRKEGVPLGKADYVSHMFQFVRPGTMPTG